MRRILKLFLSIALLIHATVTLADPTRVTIDTHALPASGFVVAFDFIDGGPPSNTVTLSQLVTDGSFAAATFTGDATAAANVMTLGDAQFFNEILLPVVSATTVSFDINMSLLAPAAGSFADAFSLFLLDPTTLLPLVTTTDATGAQSLLTIQSGDGPPGGLTVFTNSGGGLAATWTVDAAPVAAVPEPSSTALTLVGLLALLAWRGPRRGLVRSMSLMALVVPGMAMAAIHVTPSGGSNSPHDGGKWETAYSAIELQKAINNNPGAEFWLAAGGYGQLQNITDGTQLYGGFAGGPLGETTRGERDPKAHFTAFDGILIVPYDDGNGNIIVQSPATTVDGFNILGFGIILEKASPTLANNVIAGSPVGIDMRFGAAPTINDSQVSGLSSGISVAGPAQTTKVGPNRVESKPTINRTIVGGPSLSNSGATMAIGLLENPSPGTLPTLIVNASTFSGASTRALELYGNAQFTDCVIEKNGFGGLSAVLVGPSDPGRSITFERNKIRDNLGTGLLASPSSGTVVTIRNSEITGNDSSLSQGVGFGGVPHAGGVHVNAPGVQIVSSKIVGNRTSSLGGGVYFAAAANQDITRNTIVDSLIAGNTAALQGGGIAAATLTAFSVLNSTIVGNTASAGGGVWIDGYTPPAKPTVSFANTAVVGNMAPLGSAFSVEFFGTPPTGFANRVATLQSDTFASSTFNAARPSPLGAGGFTVPDALFAAPATGDYRLAGGSPLIDRGDSSAIGAYIASGGIATDLAGKPRIVGAAVDIGAYETGAAGVVDVTSQVSLSLSGLTFDRATRRYVQVATLTNTSGGSLPGPISLVFDGFPSGVTVSGMTNVTANQLPAGSPYIDVLATDFPAGALLTLNLRFDDPFNTAIRYVSRVLAGAGIR